MSGQNYDNPMRVSYSLGAYNYGTGDTLHIPVPDGFTRCRVEDISAMISTTTVGATGRVQLGITGNTDRYAELNIPVATAPESAALDRDTERFDIGHGGKGVVDITTEGITAIILTIVAATSGVAYTDITIAWW